MPDELEYPHFNPGDLSPYRWDIAAVASGAFLVEDTKVLMFMLRQECEEVRLHSHGEADWCLHLPSILGEDHSLRWHELDLLLMAGIAYCLQYQEDIAREAANN